MKQATRASTDLTLSTQRRDRVRQQTAGSQAEIDSLPSSSRGIVMQMETKLLMRMQQVSHKIHSSQQLALLFEGRRTPRYMLTAGFGVCNSTFG